MDIFPAAWRKNFASKAGIGKAYERTAARFTYNSGAEEKKQHQGECIGFWVDSMLQIWTLASIVWSPAIPFLFSLRAQLETGPVWMWWIFSVLRLSKSEFG